MIVKVKNAEHSWSYFECEVIHVCYTTLEKATDRAECVNLLELQPTPMKQEIKRLNLETIKSHMRSILTNRVCYILNNQGKTIDKV